MNGSEWMDLTVLERKKYNPFLKKVTVHREIK